MISHRGPIHGCGGVARSRSLTRRSRTMPNRSPIRIVYYFAELGVQEFESAKFVKPHGWNADAHLGHWDTAGQSNIPRTYTTIAMILAMAESGVLSGEALPFKLGEPSMPTEVMGSG